MKEKTECSLCGKTQPYKKLKVSQLNPGKLICKDEETCLVRAIAKKP